MRYLGLLKECKITLTFKINTIYQLVEQDYISYIYIHIHRKKLI